MKRLIAAFIAAAPLAALAGPTLELGYGYAYTKDMGDGTWYQEGVPHAETLKTRAFLAGLTDTVYTNGAFDVRYHLDYVYFGTQRASCLCVGDNEYNPKTHTASVPGYIPFEGSGHVQGVALTFEPGYTWRGLRFAAEAGPWVFWDTWHVQRVDPAYPGNNDLSHRTRAQIGWVAGLRIESGNTSISYRYYNEPQQWNPYPGIANGTHMLTYVWRF